MAKNLEITVLYDFYGDLLTEKQQIKGKLDEISKNIFEIEQVNQRLCGSGEITQRAKAIARLTRGIAEL